MSPPQLENEDDLGMWLATSLMFALFGIIDGFGSIQQHISCAIMVYRKSLKDFSFQSPVWKSKARVEHD